MDHLRVALVAIAIAALGPSLGAPVSARASGLIDVNVCRDLVTGRPAPASGWSQQVNAPRGYTAVGPCNGSEGSYMQALFMAVGHSYGEEARMVFSAPANTTIYGFTLWRWDIAGAQQSYGTPVAEIDAGATVVDHCDLNIGCSGEGSTVSPSGSTISESGLAAGDIAVGVVCGGGPGGECPASETAIRIYGGEITLRDPNAPSVSEVKGALTSAGEVSGNAAINYKASERGSGVYAATLLVGGAAAVSRVPDSNGGECEALRKEADGALVFDYAPPCPASVSGSLELDSAEWHDGTYPVALVVESAAGVQTVAWEGDVRFHNAPVATSGPTDRPAGSQKAQYNPEHPGENGVEGVTQGSFTAPVGAGNVTTSSFWERCNAAGESCVPIAGATGPQYAFQAADVGSTIRYATTATDKDGSATAVSAPTPVITETPPPPHSGGGSESPQESPGSGGSGSGSTTNNTTVNNSSSSAQPAVISLTGLARKLFFTHNRITRRYPRSGFAITGRLTSPSGAPLAGKTLYLLTGPIHGGGLRVVGHTTTSAEGSWMLRVPKGPSRRVRVSYGAQQANAAGTAISRDVVEYVRPAARLRVSSHGAGILLFYAHIAFGGVKPRLLAVVQARHGRRWIDVGSPRRVGRKGNFKASYQAAGLIGNSYVFRLYVPATGQSLRAISRPRRATVR
jgi:hypothetical protein